MSDQKLYVIFSTAGALQMLRHPDACVDPYPDLDDEEWLRRARRGEIRVCGATLIIKDFVERTNHVVH